MIQHIPQQFFDTHLHTGFLKASHGEDVSKWKSGTLLTGYFFESGLNVTSLKKIYPFPEKTFYAVAFPIPYGPFSPLKINQEILVHSSDVDRLFLALRGDIQKEDLQKLELQIDASEQVIGLKLYQNYEFLDTTIFLKNVLYPELLELADKKHLTFFIHTNHLRLESLDFLESILLKHKNINIVLTHAGVELGAYKSFVFEDEKDFFHFELNEEHKVREKKYLEDYELKAKRMLEIPRLFVNPALLANEITLYAICKHLAPAKKIIWGSDLPYSYASRIKTQRKSYDFHAPEMKKLFEGTDSFYEKEFYENLLFLLERMWKVLQCSFTEVEAIEYFQAMLWDTPKNLFLKQK